ncbi:hypothetical protein WG947_05795 [Pontibacter sp. H259]|uniref:hypothetical protein n=1 Tax=Pontibacter sp. H259 TaxID=3133421 RepID=UPI0030C371EF
MKLNSLFRKWWLWVILCVLLFVGLSAIVSVLYFSPWLKNKLETTVNTQTKGLYTLKLYGFSASFLGSRIAADSVHIIPDFKAWDKHNRAAGKRNLKDTKAPRTLLNLRTKYFALGGVNFISILQGKALSVNSLKVDMPVVLVTEMRTDTFQVHEPLHKSLQGIAKNLRINHIQLQNGTVRISSRKDDKEAKMYVENFTIRVDDLRLDSTSYYDETRAYYAKGMAFETGEAGYTLPDGTYRFVVGALKANTADGTLNLGNVKITPLLTYSQMARRERKAISRVRLTIPEINASGVDYKVHSRYNNLIAKLVVIKELKLNAYMDKKNYVQRGYKPLPHDLLQKLKTGLTIKQLEVKQMYARYEELAPEATKTGVITIQDLNASIKNITNDKNLMSGKNPATALVRGSINGNAPLKATIRINLLDPGGRHTLEGTFGPANPVTLNTILEPTAFISIKEGRLLKSDFRIELTGTLATGNLNLRYQNLKVDILSKDEDKRQIFRKKLLSKLANKVVIKSDNPKKGESLRPGPINVVRSKKRSVISYWKDCIVSGFRSAAGVENIGLDLSDPNR